MILNRLRSWLFSQRPPPDVVLLSRSGCHLCDEARRLLEQLQLEFEFAFQVLNVDGDAELVRKYGDKVPVVILADQPRMWGKINPAWLQRLISKSCPRRRQPKT